MYLIKRKLRFSDISPICFFARHLGVIRSLIRKTLTGALFHPASVPSFIIRKSTGKTYDKRLTTNDVPVPYNKHDESPLQTCLSFIVYYRLSIWCRRLSRVLLIGSNRPGNSLLRTTVNRQNQYIPHSEPVPPPIVPTERSLPRIRLRGIESIRRLLAFRVASEMSESFPLASQTEARRLTGVGGFFLSAVLPAPY